MSRELRHPPSCPAGRTSTPARCATCTSRGRPPGWMTRLPCSSSPATGSARSTTCSSPASRAKANCSPRSACGGSTSCARRAATTCSPTTGSTASASSTTSRMRSAGRAMLVKPLDMYPIECVVRGYLTGSGWAEYQNTQSVCGIPLPAGLANGDRLPAPIYTPAWKAPMGAARREHHVRAHGRAGRRGCAPTSCATCSLAIYTRGRRDRREARRDHRRHQVRVRRRSRRPARSPSPTRC